MVILEMADSHSSCLLYHFVWAHCVIIYVFPDEGFDLFFFGWGTYITVSYEVAYFSLALTLTTTASYRVFILQQIADGSS